MKKRERETMEWIELPNEECIRIIEEKENYKYQRILETDTIKQTKKTWESGSSEEHEKFLKPKSAAEIAWKE